MNNAVLRIKSKCGIPTQFVVQHGGLHHRVFCKKNLEHPILLTGCMTVFFHPLWCLCSKSYLICFVSVQMPNADIYTKETGNDNEEIKNYWPSF